MFLENLFHVKNGAKLRAQDQEILALKELVVNIKVAKHGIQSIC